MELNKFFSDPSVKLGLVTGVAILVDKVFFESKFSKRVVDSLADRLEEFYNGAEIGKEEKSREAYI